MVTLKKYKYYNLCSKDVFLQIVNDLDQSSIYNVKYKENLVEFYSNELIKNNGIESYRLLNKFLRKIILPNLIFILTFIIILFIFYTSPNYIREIRYDKGSVQDQIVFEYVEKRLVNKKLEININDLSKEMIIKCPHYAFIGIVKRGSIIFIKIEMEDTINKIINFENLKGDFVSKYKAYIEQIIIERGSVVAQLNTTVKVGELLVSGNLKYLNNPNDQSIYTSPKGIIIGRVIEQKSYKVKKVNTFKSYTGNYVEYKKYYLFNKSLNKQSYINEKLNYLRKETILNIFNLFKVIKEIEYIKEDLTFVYDLYSVEEYTKSLVYYELEKDRISEYEKINSIKKIAIVESDDYYEVLYLVDKSVNIVNFKQIE